MVSQPEVAERVEALMEKLISVKDCKPGTEVNLPEEDLVWISRSAREVFLSQPMLLEVGVPINICGDTHGQYHDLLRILDMGGVPPSANYLFLGDYVDRAKQSIETIALLLCYKIRWPVTFFLLRGNHECSALNRIYGFFDECKRRYSVKLWRIFGDCFNCMPIAAIVGDKIICMHGGLSPDLEDLTQIATVQRPCEVPEDGLLCDLVWSDPDPQIVGWGYNSRGVSYTFGPDVIRDFLQTHDLDLVVRAHQVVEDGYEFQAHRGLVTIFSAPNYCGEFDNAGGIMCVDADLCCSFKILRPVLPQPPPLPGGCASTENPARTPPGEQNGVVPGSPPGSSESLVVDNGAGGLDGAGLDGGGGGPDDDRARLVLQATEASSGADHFERPGQLFEPDADRGPRAADPSQ